MKLYEISDTYQRLLDAIDAGEIPEEAIADTLEAVEGELTDKLDNVACMIKSMRAEAEAIKAEADKLDERRTAKKSQAERLTQYIYDAMKKINKAKIETARNKLAIRQNPEAVTINNESELRKYIEETTNYQLYKFRDPDINKTAVKEFIKSGAAIPGASLTRAERLEVK